MSFVSGRSVGVSIFAIAAGLTSCDAGEATAGSGGVSASGQSAGGASAGSESAGSSAALGESGAGNVFEGESVPLAISGDRVNNDELGIDGALSWFADTHTAESVTSNLTTPVEPSIVKACVKGTAALVDRFSTICTTMMFTPPATDCFGEFSGAGIAMSLNQPLDSASGEATKKLLPFDASALAGFAFDIDGDIVPRRADLRITIETASGEFCNIPTVRIQTGTVTVLFSQLVNRCFRISVNPSNPTAESAQSKLLKISWQVITNTTAEVPFDFCVSNVRALLK